MDKKLWLAVLLASGAAASVAQAQSGPDRDELRATMRVLAPEASDPEPIFRKIPAPRPKKPGVNDDAPAKDLANPGGSGGTGNPGSADPVTPLDPGTPVPGATSDPVIPPEPIIPAAPDPRDSPGDFGHGVADDARDHGENARHHADPKPDKPDKPRDDKPPRGPDSKPPKPEPAQPPRDREPPGHKPRDPPHGPPHGPSDRPDHPDHPKQPR